MTADTNDRKTFTLPAFQLEAPFKLDPLDVVSREGNSDEEGFFLALALVFNDLKGLAVFAAILNRSDHDRAEVSGRAGQWSGMVVQIDRLASGILWELFQLVGKHQHVVESSLFRELLSEMPKECRDAWKLIQELSTGNVRSRDPMALALCRIRNAGAMHYWDPKALTEGFRRAFFEEPINARNEMALFSLGHDLEATRFYYADAAAEAMLHTQASDAGVADFKAGFDVVLNNVNQAIYSLVARYLGTRSKRLPPRPPLPKRGGTKKNRRQR